MKKSVGLLYLLALAAGLVIGYVDMRAKTDDNLPVVLIIILTTFIFGAVHPRNAWRWALIIGLCIPLFHIGGELSGIHPPYPVEPNVFITFIALIPAFIGAYLGALTRGVFRIAKL